VLILSFSLVVPRLLRHRPLPSCSLPDLREKGWTRRPPAIASSADGRPGPCQSQRCHRYTDYLPIGGVTTAVSCVTRSCPRSGSTMNRTGGSTAKARVPPRRSRVNSAPFEQHPSPPAGTCERFSQRLRCSPGQRLRLRRRRHLFVDEAK
jgi:hypothetical protein